MPEITPNQVLQQLLGTSRITGSWVAAHACRVKLKPGTVDTQPGDACSACGHHFLPGERGHNNPAHGSLTFNDAYSLAGDASKPICSACETVMQGTFVAAYRNGVACADGIYAFSKNVDRTWFLLNPPEPPFIMAADMANSQHLFWRTPVGLSREVFPVRVGTHVGMIRRAVLQRAHEIGAEALRAAQQHAQQDDAAKKRGRPKKEGAIASMHPFVRLDRDLQASKHGELKADVMSFIASGLAPREMNLLAELNAVELWALANVANTKPADAHTQRPPIFQPKTKAAAEAEA